MMAEICLRMTQGRDKEERVIDKAILLLVLVG